MSVLDQDQKNTDLVTLDLPPKVREYYNTLRDRILLSSDETSGQMQLIAVTACYGKEGTSTIAANLAVTLAHHGSVLLLDANVNKPSLHKIFRLDLSPGLAETLQADDRHSAISKAAQNLDVLSAGHLNGNVPILMESPQNLSELLSSYKRSYRFVVLDSPPVNEKSAALRLSSLVDGVILVVEAERTRWEAVRRVKEQLLQVKANILGIVLNKRRFPIPAFMYRR